MFQPLGVPRQVVIDHQVGVLEVDPFPGRIRGNEHARGGVVAEQLLDLQAIFAFDPAMNGHNRRKIAEQTGDLLLQIAQRVAVLRKDDQLALAP